MYLGCLLFGIVLEKDVSYRLAVLNSYKHQLEKKMETQMRDLVQLEEENQKLESQLAEMVSKAIQEVTIKLQDLDKKIISTRRTRRKFGGI